MKNRFRLTLMSLFFIVLSLNLVYAQEDINGKIQQQIEKNRREFNSRTPDEKKLHSGLFELAQEADSADVSIDANKKFSDHIRLDGSLKPDSKNRVRVLIQSKSVSDSSSILRLIGSNDGTVEKTYRYVPFILCKIDAKKLRSLISAPSIVSIDESIEGKTRDIKTEGFTQLEVNLAQAKFSKLGENVNIGVISDGVTNISSEPVPDELPLQVQVLNKGNGNEGCAILEIIHDLAPNANLYFYSGENGYQEMAEGINALNNIGCTIIVDDYGYPGEPYFTDDDDVDLHPKK